jgi:[ribosomal protein S5]-alanine N-acetyltransferase
MILKLRHSTIRSFRTDDAPSLAVHANNYKVWRNLRDLMPHPYVESDAAAFIQQTLSQTRQTNFAIEVDGAAVGAIGLGLRDNVERVGAALGYWLGEAYWGRGIISEAIPAFTRWSLDEFDLCRIHAVVFQWNPASARVLQKSGYQFEGTMRRSAIKEGQIIDRHLYAYVLD